MEIKLHVERFPGRICRCDVSDRVDHNLREISLHLCVIEDFEKST